MSPEAVTQVLDHNMESVVAKMNALIEAVAYHGQTTTSHASTLSESEQRWDVAHKALTDMYNTLAQQQTQLQETQRITDSEFQRQKKEIEVLNEETKYGRLKGKSGILDSKPLHPHIYKDESTGSLRTWRDNVESYYECKLTGMSIVLKWARSQDKEVTEKDLKQFCDLNMIEIEWKLSTQLYHGLISYTDGEARRHVRNVDNQNGFESWRMVNQAFEPRTSSGLVQMKAEIFGMISHPAKRVEEIRDLITRMDEKVRQFEDKFPGEVISDTDRISTATNLLTQEAKQHMNLHKAPTSYIDFRANIMSYVVASSKVSSGVNSIQESEDPAQNKPDKWQTEGSDPWYGGKTSAQWPMAESLDALGKGKAGGKGAKGEKVCWGCGKPGHVRAQCPTNPSQPWYPKGKGDKGGGKGKGVWMKGGKPPQQSKGWQGKGGYGKPSQNKGAAYWFDRGSVKVLK